MILYHNFTVAPVADNAGYLVTRKSPFGTSRSFVSAERLDPSDRFVLGHS
jgi:hypothetical protein